MPRRVRLVALLLVVAATPAEARGRRRSSMADVTRDGLPNIKSDSALVEDLATGQVLFGKDEDKQRPIASISKMFGALVLEDCKLDPEELHEMTVEDREAAKRGDKTKLTTGWSYTNRDLLHAALMRSDNRALPALAAECGLTPAEFAEKMTAKAKSLGLTRTSFAEPDGLSPDNKSTAREVMVALKEVVEHHPQITEIMLKTEYVLEAQKDDRVREIKIHNTDKLLTKNIGRILGGKTGYTDLARYCFAGAVQMEDGRRVGMVFLGAEGRFTRFADFTRVVHWLASEHAPATIGGGNGAAPKVVPAVDAVLASPPAGDKTASGAAAAAPAAPAASSTPPAAAAGVGSSTPASTTPASGTTPSSAASVRPTAAEIRPTHVSAPAGPSDATVRPVGLENARPDTGGSAPAGTEGAASAPAAPAHKDPDPVSTEGDIW